MQDLNATMFYKVKFHIAAIEENLDLLWRIVLHIREWMNSKWNASWEVVPCDCGCWTKLKYGGRIFSTDEKRVSISSQNASNPTIQKSSIGPAASRKRDRRLAMLHHDNGLRKLVLNRKTKALPFCLS